MTWPIRPLLPDRISHWSAIRIPCAVRAVVYAQLRRAPSTRAEPIKDRFAPVIVMLVVRGVVAEHDEMTDEVEEPTFVEPAAEQDLQLRHCRTGTLPT